MQYYSQRLGDLDIMVIIIVAKLQNINTYNTVIF